MYRDRRPAESMETRCKEDSIKELKYTTSLQSSFSIIMLGRLLAYLAVSCYHPILLSLPLVVLLALNLVYAAAEVCQLPVLTVLLLVVWKIDSVVTLDLTQVSVGPLKGQHHWHGWYSHGHTGF